MGYRHLIFLVLSISMLAPTASVAQTTPHTARPTPEPALLTDARIDSLPQPQRSAWKRYLTRSREREAADRAFMAAELTRVGAMRMRKATYARGFEITPRMSEAWFRSDSALRLGRALLTWQTPPGGWSAGTAPTPTSRT